MKKTILTTTLILGLGVSSIVSGNTAEAADINKEELAQLAQSNSSELNNAPIHEGAYSYNFNIDGVDYNFESDGSNYTWSYGGYTQAQPTQQAAQTAPVQEETIQNVQYNTQSNNTQNYSNTQNYTNTQETQQTQQVSQPSNNSNNSQAAAPVQNKQSSQSSNNGSAKSQFLAAGGTEAMWQSIVIPESGGNPNAVSPTGYRGLGQTKQNWGTGSVQEQTQGMLKYANERYGSVEAAVQFREQNNWW